MFSESQVPCAPAGWLLLTATTSSPAILEPVCAPASTHTTLLISLTASMHSLLRQPAVRILLLTLISLFVLGYHPFTDDAAIYVAGVEKTVHPALFAQHAEYILPHLQHSLFSFATGWMIRLAHLPLLPALFAAYVLSLWLTTLGSWRVSCRLFAGAEARWAATTLLAVTLALPVAGTALTFVDPYLTARSFSTPVILFALVAALDRKPLRTTLLLLFSILLHPLMGVYGAVYVAVLWLQRDQRWKLLASLTTLLFAATLAATHTSILRHASPGYTVATLSRSYFFLSRWTWYETFGLFPPLVAAWIGCRRSRFALLQNCGAVCSASLYTGLCALLFSVAFVHPSGPLLLASLQPLRVFHLLYWLFFLMLGGVLGSLLLQRRALAWIGVFGIIAVVMFTVQTRTYPSLAHLESPWSTPQNPWEQAFAWIRTNTPSGALFALDPHYQSLPQEDTVGFRAAAERSALPDWSKDGGIAAIYPQIADQWLTDASAQTGWRSWSDAQRIKILAPYHVDWVVLSATQATSLPCPYQNAVVRVCQISTDAARLR